MPPWLTASYARLAMIATKSFFELNERRQTNSMKSFELNEKRQTNSMLGFLR
jgi:hypothetical protein